MFTAPFCQALLEELEHFEQSDLPKGRPNTMNNYGVGEALPWGRRRQGLLGVGDSPAALQPSGVALSVPRSVRKMNRGRITKLEKSGTKSEAPPASLLTPGPSSQVLLHELGLDEPLVTPLRERFLQPLMALLYPDCGGAWLDSHRAFVVKYAPGQDRELGCHYDNAELTINVALGKAFTGGALYFGGLFQVSVCGPPGRTWGSQERPGLSPAVCRSLPLWSSPWRWSTLWAGASCTGAASCTGPGPWARASGGTSSSGSGPPPCATASAPCAAASPTWWTTRASATASPERSPPPWMCAH